MLKISNKGGSSYRYREDYFKHNKGLFGLGIYFCSYCGKPLFGKTSKSHVDHIVPQSKNKELLNRRFNTTIACAKCNLKKSDKITARYIAQGYTAKVIGGIGGAAVGGVVGGSYKAAKGTAKGIGGASKYGAKGFTWLLSQMFGGIFNLVTGTVKYIITMLIKNWVVSLIIGYIIFSRYY